MKPFSMDDYRDILRSTRKTLIDAGLGGVDERIVSDLRDLQGPFDELVHYIKLLIDEISLGADEQIKRVLRRVRASVHTESGEPIEGIEVRLSPEEHHRYGVERLIFGPDKTLQKIVTDLQLLLDELMTHRYGQDWPGNRGDRK